MKSLLAIEWLKIKQYRTFWVLTLFFLALLPLFNVFIYKGFISAGPKGMNILSQSYSFPGIWGNFGFWGSIFILFPSILVVILTANEYSFRTNRQNVIDGWSRLQSFHAKCIVILLFAIICTLYLMLSAGIMGAAVSGGFDFASGELYKIGYFFLLSLNYMGFAYFITTLIRKSGLAIGLFLLYSLIIEKMAQGIINYVTHANVGDFLPLQASDELLPFPLMRMASTAIGATASIPDYAYVIGTVAWIAFYYILSRSLLLRRDW